MTEPDDVATEVETATAFEQAVLAGAVLDLAGGSIDAELIRRVCIARRELVDPRGVRLRRAVVTGTLDLTGADIPFPIRIEECEFEQAPILHGVRVKELIIVGCPALPGLLANGIVVVGDLDLSGSQVVGAHATSASTSRRAAIWLCESVIGGRLLCVDTTIDPLGERALQADRMSVAGTVRLIRNFHAKGELRLVGAEVRGTFDLTGAHVESETIALDLGDAAISGNLFIVSSQAGGRPQLHGRVDLSNTRIDGQLLIRDAVLTRSAHDESPHFSRIRFHGNALTAQRLVVGAEMSIEGRTVVTGGIDLSSAELGGLAVEPGGEIRAPAKVALNLTNAEVRSDVTIGKTVQVRGTISLVGARIRGRLQLEGIMLSEPVGRSLLKADGANIDGHVSVQGVRATGGQLKFWRATLGGGFDAADAVIDNPAGATLRLHQSTVRGTVRLANGFRSRGCVVLSRSVIEGRLDLSGATLDCPSPNDFNEEGAAIQAISATFRGGMDLGWSAISPAINLTDAATTVLQDDPTTWPQRIYIAGFTYDRYALPRISGPGTAGATWDWRRRLAWLRRQAGYDAGPFEQAARVFRQHGYTYGAEQLLIAQRTHARRAEGSSGSGPRKTIDAIFGWTVGYGYRPSRVLWLLVILLALVSTSLLIPGIQGTLRASDEGDVFTTTGMLINDEGEQPAPYDACAGGRVHCFNPVIYAIDTVVPLIALDQRATWYPNHFEPSGYLVEWWLNLSAVAGWILSSIFLLSFARLARNA